MAQAQLSSQLPVSAFVGLCVLVGCRGHRLASVCRLAPPKAHGLLVPLQLWVPLVVLICDAETCTLCPFRVHLGASSPNLVPSRGLARLQPLARIP